MIEKLKQFNLYFFPLIWYDIISIMSQKLHYSLDFVLIIFGVIMNEKVLRTLEYHKIIDQLVQKADSEPGKKLCKELLPSTDLTEIRKNQEETRDAIAKIFRAGSTSFGSNKDLGFSIKSLEIGSTLSIVELLKIAGLLDNVNRIKTYGKRSATMRRRIRWIPILKR